MAAEWLRRVRALFDIAIELPPAERDRLLAAADPALRAEVGRVLDAEAQGETVLDRAVAHPMELAGQRMGRYPLRRLIATGGMAAVFEAVRPEDGARVAIKLIRAGLVRDITLRRFRQEQWILQSLAHPNIAELLDTGVAADDRPFLVMEYIAGDPITAWCDDRRLAVGPRIALFRQACAAVQHAHGQGILHRDLKPDNILVADGVVKLLDFGIAKLLQEEPALEAIRTSMGSRALTPEYASPEQIEGGSLTPATDVYSLGVVLFELLTGRLPHLRGGDSLLEFTQRVLGDTVPPPSQALTDAAARHRDAIAAGPLRDRFRAGLDQVALRALARDPVRRFPSVEALSESLAGVAPPA